MKILATAYAINPYKGSEDGMGWNFVYQCARNQKVIAITRKNNKTHIEKFMKENPSLVYENMKFGYYDLPYWMRFWKKGGRGAMIYYYMWQLFMPLFIARQKYDFDICHNLNFHNDWTPSFLWVFRKPMVWGPIGHHPAIPGEYLRERGGIKLYILDRLKWMTKQMFWTCDPFLKLTKFASRKILCMNSDVLKVLNIRKTKVIMMPSVGTSDPKTTLSKTSRKFSVLSVGRFVHLKSFDLTIDAFARFVEAFPPDEQPGCELVLIGKGPLKPMMDKLIEKYDISSLVKIVDWVDHKELEKYYVESSCFLFPSHEGAGMVVAEAMSYGKPVICLNNAGPGEFVTDSSGIKVNYTDFRTSSRLLAQGLSRLYLQPQYLEALSTGARARFVNYFDWYAKGEALNQVYKAVQDPGHNVVNVNMA